MMLRLDVEQHDQLIPHPFEATGMVPLPNSVQLSARKQSLDSGPRHNENQASQTLEEDKIIDRHWSVSKLRTIHFLQIVFCSEYFSFPPNSLRRLKGSRAELLAADGPNDLAQSWGLR